MIIFMYFKDYIIVGFLLRIFVEQSGCSGAKNLR